MNTFKILYKAKIVALINKEETTKEEAEELSREYSSNIKEINLRIVEEVERVVKEQPEKRKT